MKRDSLNGLVKPCKYHCCMKCVSVGDDFYQLAHNASAQYV